MHVVDIEEGTIDDIDSENGREELPIDDELFDATEEFALADEYHHQVGDGLEEEIKWIEQWEDDVLDMDPQSSPSEMTLGENTKDPTTCRDSERIGVEKLGQRPKMSSNGEPLGAGLHCIYTTLHEGYARLSINAMLVMSQWS